MTEDDVRRIIREEIDRARYLAPVHIAPLPTTYPAYPVQPLPMPPYWYQPATCGGSIHVSQGTI